MPILVAMARFEPVMALRNDFCDMRLNFFRRLLFCFQLEAKEQSPEEVQAHIAKIIAQGHDRFETRHRHKDGHEIDIEISVTCMAESQQLFVFCHDITKRKKADRKSTLLN